MSLILIVFIKAVAILFYLLRLRSQIMCIINYITRLLKPVSGPKVLNVLKMLCLYLLGQNCLHLTFKPYLSRETYSRQYEKLPSIVVHACKIFLEKMYLLKMFGRQIWLCLFTFRPIASKQLNGLTTIGILSWLGGAVVTHPLWVQEVPGSICLIFCIVVVVFTFLSQNTVFIAKYCNSFYNVNLFSILNVLQDLWPTIKVKRYRPSIFNEKLLMQVNKKVNTQ